MNPNFLLRLFCLVAALWCTQARSMAAATFALNKTSFYFNEAIAMTWTRESGDESNAKDWVAIYRQGQTPGASGTYSTMWYYVNGSQTSGSAVLSGSKTFYGNPLTPTGFGGSLTAGNYVAYFLRNDGYVQIAPPVSFTIGAWPTFTLNKSSYTPGEAITVTWSRPAGNPVTATDWVGIYANTVAAGTGNSPAWRYLNNSTTAPAAGVQNGSFSFTTGLPAGTYTAHILANNGYRDVAQPVTFTIAATGGPSVPEWVASPFLLRYAVSGTEYTGCVRGYAKDADAGEVLTFTKISGPSWLSISSTGVLSGTPAAGDKGVNTFEVRVSDIPGNQATATFTVEVFPPGAAHVPKVRVMSYNFFHGWGNMTNGFRKGLDSVILSNADIICTCESTDNVTGGNPFQPQKVAAEIGWYYTKIAGSGDVGILSRYPIAETFELSTTVGARIRLSADPIQEVIAFSTHLDYLYYGPYKAATAGETEASTMTEELRSQRDEQSAALVAAIQTHLNAADTTPVFVCGDFNSPSHQDWTPGASSLHYGKTIAWPATVAMTNAGLVDTFRQVHPDPLVTPGNTWSPIYNGTEPLDRIDFVFAKGRRLKTLTSEVFHTAVETKVNNYSSSLAPTVANTWPSDHAAVITEFSMAPTDTAGNGLPDYWENLHLGGVSAVNGTADTDGDGISNLLEFILGTQPLAADGMAASGGHTEADGQHFTYLRPKNGVTDGGSYVADGYRYRVMRSEDLAIWIPGDDCLTSDGPAVPEGANWERASFLITPPAGQPNQFFRMSVQPVE